MSITKALRWVVALCAVTVLAMSDRVVADDSYVLKWRGPAGDWCIPGNWMDAGSPGGAPPENPPEDGDLTFIYNGDTVRVTPTAGGNICTSVYLGARYGGATDTVLDPTFPGAGTVRLDTNASLAAHWAFVGAVGSGTLEFGQGSYLATPEGGVAIGFKGGHGRCVVTQPSCSLLAHVLSVGGAGTGIFEQTNGFVSGDDFCIGGGGGWGWYQLGGTGTLDVGGKMVLNGGLEQTGGSCKSRTEGLRIAVYTYGCYRHSGGNCQIDTSGLAIGYAGLHGGSLETPEYYTALTPGARGERGYYKLTGSGNLTTHGYFNWTYANQTPALSVGDANPSNQSAAGTGFLYLGEDDWTGQIQGGEGAGPTDVPALAVRWRASSVGVVRGWSSAGQPAGHGIHMTGSLVNNGRIIADGYGQDAHILDLSDFTYGLPSASTPAWVINTFENTPQYAPSSGAPCDNGWFAQNHGLLKLPLICHFEDVPGAAPKVLCNWGEGTTAGCDSEIDLVNSLRLDLPSGVNISASLLASDRAASADGRPVIPGKWIPLSIWKLSAVGGPASLDSFTCRNDDTALPPETEGVLEILRPNGLGEWVVPGTIARDTNNHRTAVSDGLAAIPVAGTFFALVAPGWTWNTSADGKWNDATWDADTSKVPAVWPTQPNNPTYPACIDKGATVTLEGSLPNAKASMLLLGCSENATTNCLDIKGSDLDAYSLQVHSLRLGAVDQNADGKVLLESGTLAVTGMALIGENGTGVVQQDGGTFSVGSNGIVHIGLYPTANGSYAITSGTLSSPRICVGTEGAGTLTVSGDAQVTGVQDLTIRANMYATGTLQGYGTIGTTGAGSVLTMNGKVIADGGELDLSGFGTIRNHIDNVPPYGSGDNGWFACNGGKLKLPPINLSLISTSYATFHWGETAWADILNIQTSHASWNSDSGARSHTIDLINSVQGSFEKLSGGSGTIHVELLASDHEEILPKWKGMEGRTAIGFWRVLLSDGLRSSLGTSNVVLKFRYDDTLVAAARETELEVLQWRDGAWRKVSTAEQSTIDTVDHVIWGQSVATRWTPVQGSAPSVSEAYFAVALPPGKWVWNQTTGSPTWTQGSGMFWNKQGFENAAAHPYPNGTGFPAYICNGGTATIGTADESAYMAASTLYLGEAPEDQTPGSGNVNFQAGSLHLNHLQIADQTASSGTFTLAGGTLDVGDVTVGGAGQLQGYGTVDVHTGATFTNNGKVTADGYADSTRTLDLAGFATIDNTVNNPTTGRNGWYATNKGQLTLPPITLITGNTGPYNWGEKPYSTQNTTIDLVNSLQLTPTAPVTGQVLDISLVAPDRTGTPIAALTSVGQHVIAAWAVSADASFETTATVRYDHGDNLISQTFPPACDYGDVLTEPYLVLAARIYQEDGLTWCIVGRAGNESAAHRIISAAPIVFAAPVTYLAVLQPYPGDADLSGFVDGDDLANLAYAWLEHLEDPHYLPGPDFNADGFVDGDDLAILAYFWLTGPTSSSSCAQQRQSLSGGEQDRAMAMDAERLLQDQRRESLYQALDEVGLLEAYLEYLNTHPDAAW